MLSPPGAPRLPEGGQRPGRELGPGVELRLVAGYEQRRLSRVAAEVHPAAHRVVDDLGAEPARVGSLLAERAVGGVHQRGVGRAQRLVAEAGLGHRGPAPVLDEQVGCSNQGVESFGLARVPRVERPGALAGVEREVQPSGIAIGAGAAPVRRADSPRRVRFHEHDVGSQVGEQARGEGPCDPLRAIDDTQARERAPTEARRGWRANARRAIGHGVRSRPSCR